MGKYGPEKTQYLDTFHAVVYRRKRNNETVLSGQDEGSMWGCTILGTHFKFKKNLEGKLVVTNGDLWALLDFRTPTFFTDDSDAEFHPD